jgi:16S rRNA (cytidine1402-2'-O)-methyltransferase
MRGATVQFDGPAGEGGEPRAPLAPGLYVTATPIGNLGDLTLRAREILSRVDLVLAEDTRVTAKLLAAYGLSPRVERYDDHADEARTQAVLDRILAGARVALVSDAGTPLVSDPGYRLVKAAVEQGVLVSPIPGPSAAIAALSISGLPTDRFLFAGFPPPKAAARRAFLEELAPVRATLVFYETGPRLADSLSDMAAILGDRPAMMARELTKLYETAVRGDLAALAADPRCQAPKGEIVIVVGPGEVRAASADDADRALLEALQRQGPAAAAAEVAKALGLNRRDLYRRALELKGAA